ncbi:zinc finger protein 37-like [Mya arenaria]|uniref:zinc finger protein 37-like n=1 Tax=Mya arenaria TaxID=6604 RepID=UPI0022E3270D|nr:zinc finger protein 37-like [Mya arenaria]
MLSSLQSMSKEPVYQTVLKAVLKVQIQHLVDQLANHTNEESIILTVGASDGSLTQLGSEYGKTFLNNSDVKANFIRHCINRKKESDSQAESQLSQGESQLSQAESSLSQAESQLSQAESQDSQAESHLSQIVAKLSQAESQKSRDERVDNIGPMLPRKLPAPHRRKPYSNRGRGRPRSSKQAIVVRQDFSDNDTTEGVTDDASEAGESITSKYDLPTIGIEGLLGVNLKTEVPDTDDTSVSEMQISQHEEDAVGTNISSKDKTEDDNSQAFSFPQDGSFPDFVKREDGAYVCDICSMRFTVKREMMFHCRIHTSPQVYPCKQCPGVFNTLGHLKSHMSMTHEPKRPLPEYPNMIREDGQFKCILCGYKHKKKHQLDRHFRTHTGERPYICDTCGNSFNQRFELTRHMLLHSDRKDFKCDICGNEFRRKEHLTRHLMRHSGERPFQCEECGMSFTEKSTLNMHMKIHSGNAPHKCNKCGHAFKARYELTTHMSVHTGLKPFPCQYCSKTFRIKRGLISHMTNKHKDKSEDIPVVATSPVDDKTVEVAPDTEKSPVTPHGPTLSELVKNELAQRIGNEIMNKPSFGVGQSNMDLSAPNIDMGSPIIGKCEANIRTENALSQIKPPSGTNLIQSTEDNKNFIVLVPNINSGHAQFTSIANNGLNSFSPSIDGTVSQSVQGAGVGLSHLTSFASNVNTAFTALTKSEHNLVTPTRSSQSAFQSLTEGSTPLADYSEIVLKQERISPTFDLESKK